MTARATIDKTAEVIVSTKDIRVDRFTTITLGDALVVAQRRALAARVPVGASVASVEGNEAWLIVTYRWTARVSG